MARFDGFVLIAGMRTGSNFLEETLNLLPGLECHGEVFNPGFVGHHDRRALFGMSLADRDADPLELMRRVFERSAGMGGFRLFHDHSPEVLDAVLREQRLAKIVLTRNPLDAFVSWKIATATGQWRLTDEAHRKTARIRFDAAEFEAFLATERQFRARVRRGLQVTGQTAFAIAYEQIDDVEVVNGIARYLGLGQRLDAVSDRLKRQNPAPLRDKVENFEEMQAALRGMDPGGLSEETVMEPRHGAAVPTFVAASEAPLLFLPIKGGPSEAVEGWLAALSGAEGPVRGFTRKTLRQWRNRHKAARSFTVVCHPVERSHAVFEQYILATGPGSFAAIRNHLRQEGGLPIPEGPAGEDFAPADRRAALLGFLEFVRRNLAGRTRLRSDPAFASQEGLLRSVSEILVPDMVIRADQMPLALDQLARQAGLAELPAPPATRLPGHDALAAIYDDDVEAAVRAVYNRDFTAFGFRRWRA